MNNLNELLNSPVTTIIILINIAIFGLVNTKKLDVGSLGSSYMMTIQNHQYHRVITSAFTQREVMHLFCNMYSLYNIGTTLERALGKELYILFYALIMVVGGLLSARIKKKKSPFTLSIGASGVLCGLFGIYMVIAFSIWGFAGIKSMVPTIVILVAMTLSPKIDSVGHFTGLLTGLICGIVVVNMYSFVAY